MTDTTQRESVEAARARVKRSQCLGCARPLDRIESRDAFGLMVRKRLSPEEAKRKLPRCQRCAAALCRSFPPAGERAQNGEPAS